MSPESTQCVYHHILYIYNMYHDCYLDIYMYTHLRYLDEMTFLDGQSVVVVDHVCVYTYIYIYIHIYIYLYIYIYIYDYLMIHMHTPLSFSTLSLDWKNGCATHVNSPVYRDHSRWHCILHHLLSVLHPRSFDRRRG